MKVFNYIIELNLRAKHKWSHFKIHKKNYYNHLVWGKLSVIYGQPHLEPILVHDDCLGEITRMGEDLIDICEFCGVVEGSTYYITMEEFERRSE